MERGTVFLKKALAAGDRDAANRGALPVHLSLQSLILSVFSSHRGKYPLRVIIVHVDIINYD